MFRISVPGRDQVDAKAQALFDTLQKGLGMVPNVFAVIGHSSVALEAYLGFSNALTRGAFNAKQREAIYLAVSETNGCSYCVAAHTAIGKMNGFTEEDTLKLRAATIEDPRLNILTRLAKSLVENHGKADPALVDAFFELGYTESALIELVALVVDKTFTNYVARLTNTPIDFPAAPGLELVSMSG